MSANDPPSFRSPHKTACDDDFTVLFKIIKAYIVYSTVTI